MIDNLRNAYPEERATCLRSSKPRCWDSEVESAYDLVRSGRLSVTPLLIGLTPEARDCVRALLEMEFGGRLQLTARGLRDLGDAVLTTVANARRSTDAEVPKPRPGRIPGWARRPSHHHTMAIPVTQLAWK